MLVKEFLMRPDLVREGAEYSKPVVQLLLGWIEEAKANGEVREEVDSMQALSTLLAIWNMTMLEWAAAPDTDHPCKTPLAARIDLLFQGLEK